MKLDQIKEHWDNLAKKYATDLKSTTKTPTIKKLEINAISKTIQSLNLNHNQPTKILEVGCGNGHNLFSLSEQISNANLTGIDYSSQMIDNARQLNQDKKSPPINFFVGNILELSDNKDLKQEYDIVFTDRCIINLNTVERQLKAIENLHKKLCVGGHLIILENFLNSYGNQNFCRQALGLKKRTPDKYNLFIDEKEFIKFTTGRLNLELIEANSFGSLHDLMLYVLLPAVNNGNVDYSHPIMDAVTQLLINIETDFKNSFGDFGQNRLYLFRKPKES